MNDAEYRAGYRLAMAGLPCPVWAGGSYRRGWVDGWKDLGE